MGILVCYLCLGTWLGDWTEGFVYRFCAQMHHSVQEVCAVSLRYTSCSLDVLGPGYWFLD